MDTIQMNNTNTWEDYCAPGVEDVRDVLETSEYVIRIISSDWYETYCQKKQKAMSVCRQAICDISIDKSVLEIFKNMHPTDNFQSHYIKRQVAKLEYKISQKDELKKRLQELEHEMRNPVYVENWCCRG